jgi:alpha-D-xyloside xylohydrolase
MDKIFPGIWKVTLGQPEAITPVKVCHTEPAVEAIGKLPPVAQCPIPEASLWGRQTKRGFSVRIGLQDNEQIYGLGLQLLSFNQRQSKKTLRVNSDPTANLGDTHAPVPFYLSTAGYGVLVDTARYAAFYFGVSVPRHSLAEVTDERQPGYSPRTLEENIAWVTRDRNGPVIIDIPTAEGIDIYIFGGPEMRTALQRYNSTVRQRRRRTAAGPTDPPYRRSSQLQPGCKNFRRWQSAVHPV